jgi:Na+/H+ antiporter NhaC
MLEPSNTTSGILEMLPWLRLFPPVVAVVLAIVFKDVNLALILATLSGCLLLCGFDVLLAINTLCEVLVSQLADADHLSVILFTVLLGAMIGLMNDSGGTNAVVDRMARYANTRKKGQLLTWLLGLVVFFDDYANTMLIGGAMRPLSDRLKISRAKLAFLIDATAAPIAGLALSSWTAFEIAQVTDGLAAAGIEGDAGTIFFATIPFRFYPILSITTVAAIAYTGRDFGPMLRAEEQAQSSAMQAEQSSDEAKEGNVWFAILPVTILVLIVLVGYFNDIDAYRLLLQASLGAATLAAVLPVMARKMSIIACSRSIGCLSAGQTGYGGLHYFTGRRRRAARISAGYFVSGCRSHRCVDREFLHNHGAAGADVYSVVLECSGRAGRRCVCRPPDFSGHSRSDSGGSDLRRSLFADF